MLRNKIDFIYKLNDLFGSWEKVQFLVVVGMALIMAVFQAIGVASILPFINIVMDPSTITSNHWLAYFYQVLGFKSDNSFIIFAGFVVIGLLVVGNAISALGTWIKIHFVWQNNHELACALLKKYLFMPYAYFLNQNSADLGKNVLMEVNHLSSGYLLPLINIITNAAITLVIFILLIYVNPLMTFFAAAFLILFYFLIYFYLAEKLKNKGEKRLEKNKERFKASNEALSGIKDVKILGVEQYFLNRFYKHSATFTNVQAWNQTVGQLPRFLIEVIAFGGIIGILIFFIYSNIPSQKIVPIISFFAFAGYRIMPALQEIFNSLATFKFHQASLDRVHEDMTTGEPIKRKFNFTNPIKKIIPLTFKKEIKLENIYFSYPFSSRETLNNINLSIKKNTFIAFIGMTGSGKTTLVDVILGLLTPRSGSIKVDGTAIDKSNIRNWRANLGYVPQQIYLSDNTILRNIAFGIPDEAIDLNQVKKVAQMANIREFIENELPEGYDTQIGERGVRLSGGQRQRIGIARALYHNPQILLFDEATSSLDNKTEKGVLEAIEKMAKIKTIIVIAHRLTTVKNSDKVYLLEGGKIVREGSYDEIVKIHA